MANCKGVTGRKAHVLSVLPFSPIFLLQYGHMVRDQFLVYLLNQSQACLKQMPVFLITCRLSKKVNIIIAVE